MKVARRSLLGWFAALAVTKPFLPRAEPQPVDLKVNVSIAGLSPAPLPSTEVELLPDLTRAFTISNPLDFPVCVYPNGRMDVPPIDLPSGASLRLEPGLGDSWTILSGPPGKSFT